jgi:excisionase family DNA binding protein
MKHCFMFDECHRSRDVKRGDMDGQTGFEWEEIMEHETLLNAGQVARMLGMSVATIRKWVLTRYIPYQKMGRAVRFSAPEIREWQKSRCVAPLETRQAHSDANWFEGGGQ